MPLLYAITLANAEVRFGRRFFIYWIPLSRNRRFRAQAIALRVRHLVSDTVGASIRASSCCARDGDTPVSGRLHSAESISPQSHSQYLIGIDLGFEQQPHHRLDLRSGLGRPRPDSVERGFPCDLSTGLPNLTSSSSSALSNQCSTPSRKLEDTRGKVGGDD